MLIHAEIYDSIRKLQCKRLRWDHNPKVLGLYYIPYTIKDYYFSTIGEDVPFCS